MIQYGEATVMVDLGSVYTDAGATAVDNQDGDLSGLIEANGIVDTMHWKNECTRFPYPPGAACAHPPHRGEAWITVARYPKFQKWTQHPPCH